MYAEISQYTMKKRICRDPLVTGPTIRVGHPLMILLSLCAAAAGVNAPLLSFSIIGAASCFRASGSLLYVLLIFLTTFASAPNTFSASSGLPNLSPSKIRIGHLPSTETAPFTIADISANRFVQFLHFCLCGSKCYFPRQ